MKSLWYWFFFFSLRHLFSHKYLKIKCHTVSLKLWTQIQLFCVPRVHIFNLSSPNWTTPLATSLVVLYVLDCFVVCLYTDMLCTEQCLLKFNISHKNVPSMYHFENPARQNMFANSTIATQHSTHVKLWLRPTSP